MSLSDKQSEFALMVAVLIQAAHQMGLSLTFGHAWRDSETQKRLVAQGLSKTENSKHLDRLAVDFNLFKDGKYITDKNEYRPLGELWEKIGGRWGGRFGLKPEEYDTTIGWDSSHFEWKDG